MWEERRSAELRAEEMSRMTGLDLYLDRDEGPGDEERPGVEKVRVEDEDREGEEKLKES